jgi:hypothetical protein
MSIQERVGLQKRVGRWIDAAFGREAARDTEERNHRFLEEALELVQSCGCTQLAAHQLVDYVFSRPVGEKQQELGGTMTTLAALANAQELDMQDCAELELLSMWARIDRIRTKHAAKPKHSPLPGVAA